MCKVIFIEAVEHRDRDGNTYFSAKGFVDGELKETIQYAYGYGSHYEYEILKKLSEKEHIPTFHRNEKNGAYESPWRYCERNNIIYHNVISQVSSARKVKNFVE